MYGMATIVNTILYICILYIWNLLRVNLKVFITEKSYNYVCWWILTKHRDHLIAYGNGGLVAKSCPTPVTPWTVTHQAPLSMGSSRQEYWSGFPFSSPGDLPDPGIEPRSPILQADHWTTRETINSIYMYQIIIHASNTWNCCMSHISKKKNCSNTDGHRDYNIKWSKSYRER